MRVAVVVVLYDSADVIEGFVDSLDAGLCGVDWQLVVVDNASSDCGIAIARRLAPGATFVETGRNGGYAAGINAGIDASASFDAVLIMNPDVRLHPGCVVRLSETLGQPNTGIAVPKLVDANGGLIASQRREPSIVRAFADALIGATRAGRVGTLGEVVSDVEAYEHERVVDWAEGSTMLVGADCLAAVGRWDESYFLYSEETEYALRARDAGFVTRYQPAATAQHLEGGSSTTPGLWTLVVLNRVRLYRRRHHLAPSVIFWLAVVAREGSRALLGQPTSRMAVRALLSPRRLRQRPGPHTVRAT